jgi:adenosylcobinamide-phosphate synthase
MALWLNTIIVIGALLLEAAAGYPSALFRRIRHPVVWIGALLGALERRLNRPGMPEATQRLNGVLAVGTVIAATVAAAVLLEAAVLLLLPAVLGLVVLIVLASTLIAARSLYVHVADVAVALETGGVDAGREAVAKIVGRDTSSLDEAGVARAAIESLAENFSDGVVAPSFWGVLLGFPGMAAYKAINTADSMIGHLDERHAAFGAAAAKLDDLFNVPASRLATLWLVLAAGVHRDASVKAAFAIARRDGSKHRSPNAGWPEAAMAGGLGLKLCGPRDYHGATADEPWIGDGTGEIGVTDIRLALKLYVIACIVQILVLVVLLLVIARL